MVQTRTLLAAAAAVLGLAAPANADVLYDTVASGSTQPGGTYRTSPSGKFTTQVYPNGGYEYRVLVDYGVINQLTNEFEVLQNSPAEQSAGTFQVGRGVTGQVWGITQQNWSFVPGTSVLMRARLQRRTNGTPPGNWELRDTAYASVR